MGMLFFVVYRVTSPDNIVYLQCSFPKYHGGWNLPIVTAGIFMPACVHSIWAVSYPHVEC